MTITLANLAQATEQEIFDQVARHLLKQKVRAVDSGGACKYRTPSGLKCAAGCLIADNEYTNEFEMAGNWTSVTKRQSQVTTVHEYFITQLQRMHDVPIDPDFETVDGYFATRLNKFANRFNLKFDLEELSK